MIPELLELFRGNPATAGVDEGQSGKPGPFHLAGDVTWAQLLSEHLLGTRGIGVYPYSHAMDGVVWGCVDFDEGEDESWTHALNLRDVLYSVGIEGIWIERSRSKGYHVWVFASDWTPASVMRRVLIGACQVVAAPTREVNPKSEYLSEGQLGNFVRLPYKGWLHEPGDRQVVVDLLGRPLPPELFVLDAMEHRAFPRFLAMVANTLYVAPEPPALAIRPYEGPWLDRLNGLAQKMLEEGPRRNDRSVYLMAFGHACAESGLEQDDIAKAVRLADEMHTHKYHHRRDAEARYDDIARKGLVPTPYDEDWPDD